MGVTRKERAVKKANARTARTAVQLTPAAVIGGLLTAFTEMTTEQMLAVCGTVNLLTVYVQNYFEGRTNHHLFEEPQGPAYEPELP